MPFPSKIGLYDPSNEKDACGVGLIVDLNGDPTRRTVLDAVQILNRLEHRGACCQNQGDGAGILLKMPHEFIRNAFPGVDSTLLRRGLYGTGIVFLPRNPHIVGAAKREIIIQCMRVKLELIKWRVVPTRPRVLSEEDKAGEPSMEMPLIVPENSEMTHDEFETRLFIVRKLLSHKLPVEVYFASLSSRTLVYKGQLTGGQLMSYLYDISHPTMKTSMALVHARYSTNTFPS